MRAFVTGGNGFVGGFLLPHLAECGDEIIDPFIEITDADAIGTAIAAARPEVIYHVAGQANVSRSWDDPAESFAVNALGTLHVLEAAWRLDPMPRVLLVSSGEVYGKVSQADLPVTEDHPVRPSNPYGASKAAAEIIALQTFRGRGLPVIVARPFNHIGPGQSDAFVVSAVARQIAEAELSGQSEIQLGNLSASRDFSDVRDVVRAYRMCVERGVPGSVYNVCSGVAVPIQDIVDILLGLAARPITAVLDPTRLRPSDVPELRGDRTRITRDTGWLPQFAMADALAATLEWWRSTVRSNAQPG